jgi:hypothetical protein
MVTSLFKQLEDHSIILAFMGFIGFDIYVDIDNEFQFRFDQDFSLSETKARLEDIIPEYIVLFDVEPLDNFYLQPIPITVKRYT